jgi:hypothetical protein
VVNDGLVQVRDGGAVVVLDEALVVDEVCVVLFVLGLLDGTRGTVVVVGALVALAAGCGRLTDDVALLRAGPFGRQPAVATRTAGASSANPSSFRLSAKGLSLFSQVLSGFHPAPKRRIGTVARITRRSHQYHGR